MNLWSSIALEDGLDLALADLRTQITNSGEFAARFGGLDAAEQVDAVFFSLFNTLPTADERAALVDQITSHGAQAAAIIDTAVGGAAGANAAAFDAKVTAAQAFTSAVPPLFNDSALPLLSRSFVADVHDQASLELALAHLQAVVAGDWDNNVLTGTAADDLLFGDYGDDVLQGGGGDDYLHGGGNDDQLSGGAGNDTYVVDGGDTVTEAAGEGMDTVVVEGFPPSTYTLADNVEHLVVVTYLSEGIGNELGNMMTALGQVDSMSGLGGADSLFGSAYKDRLDGGAGYDYLSGAAGDDALYGGDGNDELDAGTGFEVADGGAGDDVLHARGNFADYVRTRVTANITRLDNQATGEHMFVRDVEHVLFLDGEKSIAEVNANLPDPGGVVAGTAGDDMLDSSLSQQHTLAGGQGSDSYFIDAAHDKVVELPGEGNDSVLVSFAAAGTYVLPDYVEAAAVNGPGNLAVNLTGNELDNNLFGNDGANSLAGGAGNDVLNGAGGADVLAGDAGDDIYFVDDAGDVVTEAPGQGTDTVFLEAGSLATYTLPSNVEDLSYFGEKAFTGTGNAAGNWLNAGDGNDTLSGLAGNDGLSGGNGNDVLDGGDDDDFLDGGQGNDVLLGGDGDDSLRAGTGNDVADGGAGDDSLSVEGLAADFFRVVLNDTDTLLIGDKSGEQILLRNVERVYFGDVVMEIDELRTASAGDGNDTLSGTDGSDLLDGGAGNDTLSGGAGDDYYLIDNHADQVVEAFDEGKDQVDIAFGVAGTYALPDHVENAKVITGGTVAIGITGNALDNVLTGNGAANALDGGAGNDVLDGGAGADSLSGGAGDDTYIVDDAGDVVVDAADGGTDAVRASLSSYTLAAHVENLFFLPQAAAGGVTATGNALDNRIESGAGNDVLSGGDGNDLLDPGTGDDVVDGGTGADTMVVAGSFGDYLITRPTPADTKLVSYMTNQSIVLRNVEHIQFADGIKTLAEVQQGLKLNIPGGPGNDKLMGTDGPDRIDGGAGSDTLTGGKGDDTYVVDVAADKVVEKAGEGNDTVEVAFTAAGTYVLADNVEAGEVTAADTVAVNLTGNTLNNSLYGNGAANTLTGGAGNDHIDGGAGKDVLVGGAGDDFYSADASDVITEAAGGGKDSIFFTGGADSYTMQANIEDFMVMHASTFSVTGNATNNLIIGGIGHDTIAGLGGNDRLVGNWGNDVVLGGDGNDSIDAGTGKDVVDGGAGDDTLTVLGKFADYVRTHPAASDTMLVNEAEGESIVLRNVERVVFADGTRTIAEVNAGLATPGNDKITGTDGDDVLDGGTGKDSLTGGKGDDTYIVDNTGDSVTEAADAGTDTVRTTLDSYTLPVNVEILEYAGAKAFTGTGNAQGNVIAGGSGNDKLAGLAGNDMLFAGTGVDLVDGGAGDDTLLVQGKFGDYVRSHPNATDTVLVNQSTGEAITLRGIEHVAFLDGDRSIEEVLVNVASAGNDSLVGTDGNDVLDGGAGADTLAGGKGDDLYKVDNPGDKVVEQSGAGTDQVDVRFAAAGTFVLLDNVEHATVVSAATVAVNLTGNALDNRLAGNGAANALKGGDGDDYLDGGAGKDTMHGGAGDDTYIVDNAGDIVNESLGAGTDEVRIALDSVAAHTLAANVERLEHAGVKAFTGTGNGLDNWISSGSGNDKLSGLAGSDHLSGNGGNDVLLGGDGDDWLDAGTGVDVADGGAGSKDTLTVLGKFADYVRSRPAIGDTVLVGTATGENITLRGVEYVQFADGVRTIDEVNYNIASPGSDTLSGGAGDDVYVVNVAGDKVLEEKDGGHDLVRVAFTAAGTWELGDNVEDAAVSSEKAFSKVAINLTGNALDNVLTGNAAANTLTGGDGADTLVGNGGKDKLVGGAGDDTYVVADASATVVEGVNGGAADKVSTTLAKYTLAANVEVLAFTGTGAFAGTGNALDNVIRSGAGNDKLLGGDGNDALWAGTGTDVADGGAGDDTLHVLGDFADYVRTSPNATDTLLVNTATGENITLRGIEHVGFANGTRDIADVRLNSATPGADTLAGTIGADRLDGGLGSDTLAGGLGDDTYVVNVATDKVEELAGEGIDSVLVAFTAAARYELPDDVENATVTAAASVAVNLTGNSLDNVLTGNGAANILAGGAGSDRLTGGSGKDVFVLDDSVSADTLLDFKSGLDQIRVLQGAFHVGNGNTTIDAGTLRTAPGGFATKAELVIFAQHIKGEITADSAAAVIGSATGAYADGATALFVVNNGAGSKVYGFTSSGADALVTSDELTEVATLVGTPATALKDFVFAA